MLPLSEIPMKLPVNTMYIKTLGSFCMYADGVPVTTEWPDDTLKVMFCSLLSPLDSSVTWDRICDSLWGKPATSENRLQLEESIVQPLTGFLVRELGFNPFVAEDDGIRIDRQHIQLDAHEFHGAAVAGLQLWSRDNNCAAYEKFNRAKTLYSGCYLPGMSSKIIKNTRNDLESLYLSAILDAMPHTRNSAFTGRHRLAEFKRYVTTEQKMLLTQNYGMEW
jgi:two-component SAPR family response regulator